MLNPRYTIYYRFNELIPIQVYLNYGSTVVNLWFSMNSIVDLFITQVEAFSTFLPEKEDLIILSGEIINPNIHTSQGYWQTFFEHHDKDSFMAVLKNVQLFLGNNDNHFSNYQKYLALECIFLKQSFNIYFPDWGKGILEFNFRFLVTKLPYGEAVYDVHGYQEDIDKIQDVINGNISEHRFYISDFMSYDCYFDIKKELSTLYAAKCEADIYMLEKAPFVFEIKTINLLAMIKFQFKSSELNKNIVWIDSYY